MRLGKLGNIALGVLFIVGVLVMTWMPEADMGWFYLPLFIWLGLTLAFDIQIMISAKGRLTELIPAIALMLLTITAFGLKMASMAGSNLLMLAAGCVAGIWAIIRGLREKKAK